MSCDACGAENPPANHFCGAHLIRRCTACGHVSPLDHRFCGGCGTTLTGGDATPPVRSPSATVPRLLAEKICQAKPSIEGERKQVTVLFADVKGSMEMAAQLDTEEWSAIMQRFFRILADGVERFEGFVDKVTGDGIMALFGAPIAHEDQSQRACYGALHLCEAARAYANEVRAQHGVPVAVRIGVNSGEVVVGRIGP